MTSSNNGKKAGLDAARKQGRLEDRPAIDEKTKRNVVTLFQVGDSVVDIAEEFSIGVCRYPPSSVVKILLTKTENTL
ncbi:hypothetical protein [Peribacillus loiseleuriae]|uniref:hypothetical protein n=1 Tax=Peribacillus loiseleuriae TaxID=1679170 RepID=UPI0012E2E1C7|nr:hypothetical protein [Peribacillus loiseleuriae]